MHDLPNKPSNRITIVTIMENGNLKVISPTDLLRIFYVNFYDILWCFKRLKYSSKLFLKHTASKIWQTSVINIFRNEISYTNHILITKIFDLNDSKDYKEIVKSVTKKFTDLKKIINNLIGNPIKIKSLLNFKFQINFNTKFYKFSKEYFTNFKKINKSIKIFEKRCSAFTFDDFIGNYKVKFSFIDIFKDIDKALYHSDAKMFRFDYILKIVASRTTFISTENFYESNVLIEIFYDIIDKNQSSIFYIIPHLYGSKEFFVNYCKKSILINDLDYSIHLYLLYVFELWLKVDWKLFINDIKDEYEELYDRYEKSGQNLRYFKKFIVNSQSSYVSYRELYFTMKINVLKLFCFLIKPHINYKLYGSILLLSAYDTYINILNSQMLSCVKKRKANFHILNYNFPIFSFLSFVYPERLFVDLKSNMYHPYENCSKNEEKLYLPFFLNLHIFNQSKGEFTNLRNSTNIFKIYYIATIEVFLNNFLTNNIGIENELSKKTKILLEKIDKVHKFISIENDNYFYIKCLNEKNYSILKNSYEILKEITVY
ncbi:hypothetical protein GVAV_002045 [Gurleya vavrai]